MQKQTWKDFLSGCDVSNWSWSSLDGLNIIGEDEEDDSYLVRLDLATVRDEAWQIMADKRRRTTKVYRARHERR